MTKQSEEAQKETTNFGISNDLQASTVPTILPPQPLLDSNGKEIAGKYNFPVVNLIRVYTEKFTTKKEEEKMRLCFHFKEVGSKREYTERLMEFDINKKDSKGQSFLEVFNRKIKHIYEQLISFPKEGIGKNATSITDYFEKIAVAFNTGREGKPIFTDKDGNFKNCWLKLLYYKQFVQIPYSPNFIERVVENKACTLSVSSFDPITQQRGKEEERIDTTNSLSAFPEFNQ